VFKQEQLLNTTSGLLFDYLMSALFDFKFYTG